MKKKGKEDLTDTHDSDSSLSDEGAVFGMLREYLQASTKQLEMQLGISMEQFRSSSEKFDRERQKSQEQLDSSSERFVRQMEQSREYLKLSSDKFLRNLEKSQELFRSSTEKYGRQQESPWGRSQESSDVSRDARSKSKGSKVAEKFSGGYKSVDIWEKFDEAGLYFTEKSTNKEIRESSSSNEITEIDILLENDSLVLAIEVKSKPTQSDIDDHIERVDLLRRIALRRGDSRAYKGAFAGNISKATRDYALQKDLFIIEKIDNALEIITKV